MFKNIILATIIGAVLIVGAARPAIAVTTTEDLQAQIKELLAKVAALQEQLKILRGQGTTAGNSGMSMGIGQPTGMYKHRICMIAMHTLSEGQNNDDVRALQEFLQSEKTLTAAPTGFFGPLTREALKKWQAEQGIEAVGIAGPKTAERLRMWCDGSVTPGERFSASPMSGEAPLTVVFNSWISGFRVENIYYTIDFGDGTSERAADCDAPADACINPGQNKHTYTANGTYTVTLNKITDVCAGNPLCLALPRPEVVAKEQIHVGQNTACTKEYMPVCGSQPIVCITTPCNPIPTTYNNRCEMNNDNATFLYEGQCRTSTNKPPTISGLSGPTALQVDEMGTWTVKATDPENGPLSYSVDWGENIAILNSLAPARAPFGQTSTFTHAYADDGIYRVTVTVTDSAGQVAQTTATVKVGNEPIACTLQYKPVCGRPPGCANTCTAGMACPAICKLYDPQTYGNRCQLDASGAEFISTGQCTNTTRTTY